MIILMRDIFMKRYKKDDLVEVTVTGFENYGIFVSINANYTGLIHISEISDDFVRNINDYITVGEKIMTKVLEVDEENKKMKLSIKNVDYKMDDSKMLESPKGFDPLAHNLNNWIEDKLKDIK